jgi:hypothetical protein
LCQDVEGGPGGDKEGEQQEEGEEKEIAKKGGRIKDKR